MTANKMHDDEVETSVALVARLLSAQFPQWADLSITPVPSAGTDNALYRLGDELAVRLPRVPWATGQVDKEQQWLPRSCRFPSRPRSPGGNRRPAIPGAGRSTDG